MIYKITPLSSGFMLASIIGFMVSSKYIYPQSTSFGFSFSMMFILMFIAALISMTLAPIDAELDIKREKKRVIKNP